MRVFLIVLILVLTLFSSGDAEAWRAKLVKNPETHKLSKGKGYLLFVVESDAEFRTIKLKKVGSVEENSIATNIEPGTHSYLLEMEPGDYSISSVYLDATLYINLRRDVNFSFVVLPGYVNYAGHLWLSNPLKDNDVHTRMINRSAMAYRAIQDSSPTFTKKNLFAYTHIATYDEFFSWLQPGDSDQ